MTAQGLIESGIPGKWLSRGNCTAEQPSILKKAENSAKQRCPRHRHIASAPDIETESESEKEKNSEILKS